MQDKDVAGMVLSTIFETHEVRTYTWLNHFSCLLSMSKEIVIEDFDFVGVDGQLLASIVRLEGKTTAADRVLPLTLVRPMKVILVGGTPEKADKRIGVLQRKFPDITIVGNHDGFTQDLITDEFAKSLFSCDPDLIIIGTGTPSQECLSIYLKDFSNKLQLKKGIAIVTCGGWLDQIIHDSYYPQWSYALKCNWLIRLTREPRRLWRRYSIDAFTAILKIRRIRNYLVEVVS